MVTDNQTNKVYLAEGLSHYVPVCRNLLYALHNEHIPVEFLPFTSSSKHVWARDYMPIQLDKGLFFFYEYCPDYLRNDFDYIPLTLKIIDELHIGRIHSDIILDGGNVVKCGDKVIMTDKIFKENPRYARNELLAVLEDLMEVQIILIPWDRYEMFGHADGMVRYISGDRVLLNNYADFDPDLRQRLFEALAPYFTVEELVYGKPRCSKMSWAYLNFLQTKSCIFVPGLHTKEDSLALRQIQRHYPDHKVVQIQGCEELARDGGALNCISWNILADVPQWTFTEEAHE